MNLCIDCRWLIPPSLGVSVEHAECGHLSAEIHRPLSPVTGEPQPVLRGDCRTHRKSRLGDDPCGPDGKYFEAREGGFT